ncbi:hypothetical protein N7520_009650 [Penicillium odoratum]|uniref:uncharacterized protein n=1 Tax=Penicillium odoratum TaxID=1167516 RepID=UPI0025489067|nr:uncharacterized protein N7520_009650 [Penicillium odoratum]KAJ5752733.1 hypothetical protein N7520_009650 [Penicillium odoratum]
MKFSRAFPIVPRECNGDTSVSSCEKPTSEVLTVGVPAAISGVIVVAAIIVFVYLHFRSRAIERREGLRDIELASRYHHGRSQVPGSHSTTHHFSDHQTAGNGGPYSTPSTSMLRYGLVAPTAMLKAEGYQEILEPPSYENSQATSKQSDRPERNLTGNGKVATSC